ncbi:MAG: lipopolysaccharide transport periplasmic protein LptA [Thiobacillaceae bacterium]|nr:lipopolysaccharide transport periplasmic protein LptA [Thiobacillaceae bacterium]
MRRADRCAVGAACLAALLGVLPLSAQAERADRDKPVHIEADTARMDDLQKLAVYEGRVILTQGTLRVQAERIEVRQDADGFLSGVATGKPAHFRQRLDGRGEWVDAWANRVEYDGRKELVRLIGEAYVKKGEEELRGDLITYDAKTEQYFASGALPGQKAGRVRAVILPREAQSGRGGQESAPRRPEPSPAQTRPEDRPATRP